MKLKLETGDKKIKDIALYDLVVNNNSDLFDKYYWINTIKIMAR